MRRAVLLGYFGQGNAGDDAFLRIGDWAVRRYFGATMVLASTPVAPPWGGVLPLWLPSRLPAVWRLKNAFESTLAWKAEHIVLAGGSNLHSSAMLTRFIQLIRRGGPGPHFAVGIGVGPFQDEAAAGRCRELLELLAFVGCRDRQSYERATALAPAARIELTADLAPLLPMAANAPAGPNGAARRGLGVSVCRYEGLTGQDPACDAARLDAVVEGIVAAVGRDRIPEVVLIDMNNHPRTGDVGVHDELARRLAGAVPIRRVLYDSDPVRALAAIAGVEGLLTMRLHGAVFAYCVQTPAVMLAYHEKCYGWADSVGMPPALVVNARPVEPRALDAALAMLAQGGDDRLPTLPLASAQERALRNWNWLPQAMEFAK